MTWVSQWMIAHFSSFVMQCQVFVAVETLVSRGLSNPRVRKMLERTKMKLINTQLLSH